MKSFESIETLKEFVSSFFDFEHNKVLNKELLLSEAIDTLVWASVFGAEGVKLEARKIIYQLAAAMEVYPASIHELYMAIGRGEIEGFTVPAMNLRCMTYDLARRVFKVAESLKAGAFIFEIAKSEMKYTSQDPSEYATVVLAAAVKEGYKGPVFIQGDHFQVDQKKFSSDQHGELQSLKHLIKVAIGAGFFNIDIDASTVVDYSKTSLKEQQHDNFTVTAVLTEYIREIQPEGITVSVGAEIGHIGGKNSTVEEAKAFMEGYNDILKKGPGISKLSVQTGTTHGGIPLPDGSVAEVKLDFSVLKEIGELVKTRYGLSGTVQHGASTLPEELFNLFPENNCSEIHLATGFQNLMYEQAPEELRAEIYEYIKQNYRDQWRPEMTEEQFLYKTRKYAFGPFKKRWWALPENDRNKILNQIEKKLENLFKKLRIMDTYELVKQYIKPVKFAPKFYSLDIEHEVTEDAAD